MKKERDQEKGEKESTGRLKEQRKARKATLAPSSSKPAALF
jgi:hypothetical protein